MKAFLENNGLLLVLAGFIVLLGLVVLAAGKKKNRRDRFRPIRMNTGASPKGIRVYRKKSSLLAFLLALFFGPLGLFFASIHGGVIMLLLNLGFGALLFFGQLDLLLGNTLEGLFNISLALLFFLLQVPICIIWALVSTHLYNKKQKSF